MGKAQLSDVKFNAESTVKTQIAAEKNKTNSAVLSEKLSALCG